MLARKRRSVVVDGGVADMAAAQLEVFARELDRAAEEAVAPAAQGLRVRV